MLDNASEATSFTNASAIVVTYNRLDWLKKNIAALKNQTRKVDTICIVDNASTDGTHEFLIELEKTDSQIRFIRLEENTGGAGGFFHGMKYAQEHGAKWFWIMDDDCIPQIDCFETLVQAYPPVNKAIICPLAVSLEDKQTQIWYEKPFKINSGIHRVKTAPFTGLLTNHFVISEIGLPDKDFFIYADDVEYSLRASQKNIPIYVSTSAILFHPYKAASTIDFGIFKLPNYECTKLRAYYATRNNIICNKRYNVTVKPLSEHFKTLFKLIVAGKFNLAALKIKGIVDGLQNRVYVRKV